MKSYYSILFFIIASLCAQEKPFTLIDGTVIRGTIQEETDSTLQVQTKFGIVTINKSELIETQYEVKLKSGETLVGIKISENTESIILKTQMGELTIQRSDILNIQEAGQHTTSGIIKTKGQYRRPYSISDFLFSGRRIDKDTDFALGEEQLIDLFFDPTGYTLARSTLYLSGLSFGFGVTDRFQITTKWGGFFWGDLNLRPKIQLFGMGNWENQHSLSVGAHYHTRWLPNKYEWKSGSINVIKFTGESDYSGGINQYELISTTVTGSDGNDSTVTVQIENANYNPNYGDWQQTAPADTVPRYWGGYYRIGENSSQSDPTYDTPTSYDPNATGVYYDSEPSEECCFGGDDDDDDDNFIEMIELFGAYTYSKARVGLKGRISHTLGWNLQYFSLNDETSYLMRAYYGLDVDINSKLKMIGELFYDPYFLELWQQFEYEDNYYDSGEFSITTVDKPDNYRPVHLDFGFIYALNESFRFGIHFQRPFVAFYWKF